MYAQYRINKHITPGSIIKDALAISHAKEIMVEEANKNLLDNGYISKIYHISYAWREYVGEGIDSAHVVLSLLVCVFKVDVAPESTEVKRDNEEAYLFRKYLREGYSVLDARGKAAHETSFECLEFTPRDVGERWVLK